jgi:hypothetical protein
MQTEWIYKEVGSQEGTGNWLERLFGDQDLSATQDQFKTRIERGPQGESRIYVAHRGAEYNYVLDTNERSKPLNDAGDDDSEWRARQRDAVTNDDLPGPAAGAGRSSDGECKAVPAAGFHPAR